MTITKRCPHCDTALEFKIGQHMCFTAHDDASCHLATRERVHILERALIEQRESYERHIADYRRSVDRLLVEHGLPTLEERAKRHEAAALLVLAQSGVLDLSGLGDCSPPATPRSTP